MVHSVPDFRTLFESAPGLYLVLTPDLRIVAASDAYLRATMMKRDEIAGRDLFAVLPNERNLRVSLERVLRTGTADTMAGGELNTPVLGAGEEIAYIIHRVQNAADMEVPSRVCHELRNALHTVIGFSELLAEERAGALGEAQKGFVKHIQKGAMHLLDLINEMENLSRMTVPPERKDEVAKAAGNLA